VFASGLRREERGMEEGAVEVIEAVEVMVGVVEVVDVEEVVDVADEVEMVDVVVGVMDDAVDVVEFKEDERENTELFAKRLGEKVLFVLAIGIALLFADASKGDEEENANERGVRINEKIMRKMKKDFAANPYVNRCSSSLELLVDIFLFLFLIAFSVVFDFLILVAFISSSLTIKFDIQHCLYFYI